MNSRLNSAPAGSSRRSTPSRSRRRRLAFDQLEARDNPSGNVTATMGAGNVLILTGDHLDNQIQISTANNLNSLTTVTVTGLDNETIGGQLGFKTFDNVRSLRIVLKGGNDVVTSDSAAGDFEFFGAVAISLGDGNNQLDLNPAGRLFMKRLTVTAGDGADAIAINGNPASPDNVDHMTFQLGDGSNSVALNSFKSVGPLKISAGDGHDSLTIENVDLIVANTVDKPAPITAQMGGGAATMSLINATVGAVTLASKGDASLFANGVTTGAMTVAAGRHSSALTDFDSAAIVKGNLTVRGNSANLFVGAGDSLSVLGSLNVQGAASASMDSDGTTEVAHGLTVQATAGHAQLNATGTEMTVGGNLMISGAQGVGVSLHTANLSSVKGNATFKGGPSADDVNVGAQFKVGKNLSIALGGGDNQIHMVGPTTTPGVGGNLSITTGAGADQVILDGLSVAGKTSVVTGAGADTLSILSGSTFTGATTINLGTGDDVLSIAPPGGAAGPVTFTGKLTAGLGAGNDSLILGSAGDGANGNVVFGTAANKINGGLGNDLFNNVAGQFNPTKVVTASFEDPTP